jgi:dihydroorotate dehydrogenase electron transfer subunit
MSDLQGVYSVVSNEKLSPCFWRMEIDAPPVQSTVKPGQFIHVKVNDGMEPFFRRPFSVYRALEFVEIFYEVVGVGTRILSEKKRGDCVDVVGPVGTPFTLPGENIRRVVMIAGGIGVAPFLILSDEIKNRALELILLYGGRTVGHVYPMEEFRNNGVDVRVTTDDGSAGTHGRVTDLFGAINWDPETTMIYTCGPHPMMRAVQEFAGERGILGQAACEEVMACALGACLGCSIKTTSGYKTVCYEGPVFALSEIIFDH